MMTDSKDDAELESDQKKEVTLPVDKDWLVDMINAKSDAKGVLKGLQCETIGDGKGFLSVITRVTLYWDEDSSRGIDKLPKGVIIKKPTLDKLPPPVEDGGFTFDMKQLMDFHNRECRTYTYLLKYPPAPIPMARFFYSEEMEQEGGGLLILEDLTEKARSITFIEDPTVEQVKALAGHVARLQAYGFKHPDYVDYMQEVPVNPFERMFQGLDYSFELVEKQYPGKLPWTAEEFRKLYDERFKVFQMFGLPCELEFTKVLSLGDVQPNNILWHRGGPSGEDTSADVAALLDFQLFHVGNCMNDIGNTMTFGMPAEIRRENTETIIDHYFKCLREAMEQGGGDQSVPVTKEEASRIQLELMFQFATMGLCMFPMFETVLADIITPERKEDAIDRHIASLQDALAGLKKYD